MARSKSSARWLDEHFDDEYVQRAQRENYRSRAVYKLQEIDQRVRLFKPGMQVIDLGAAPGAWTQYVVKALGRKGRVFAVDLLEMEPLDGATVLQGDINDLPVFEAMQAWAADVGKGAGVDLVISDMAPNMSGNRAVDQPRSIQLCDMALDSARELLVEGGALLMKAFEGEGIEQLRVDIRQSFRQMKTIKPKASRPRSREVYLLGIGRLSR